MFANAFRQHLTPLRRQQLGIPQTAHAVRRIEDHRRSDHRAKQRSAPYFVDASHQRRA